MKTWANRFWKVHGDRVFFMTIVFLFGCLFIALGLYVKGEFGNGMVGTGVSLWMGCAAIANNKARSPEEGKDAPEDKGAK